MKTYILYNIDYNLFKIGVSKNVKRRVAAINIKHKSTKLICTINYNLENHLHYIYSKSNINVYNEREWFYLDDLDLDFLLKLSRLDDYKLDMVSKVFTQERLLDSKNLDVVNKNIRAAQNKLKSINDRINKLIIDKRKINYKRRIIMMKKFRLMSIINI